MIQRIPIFLSLLILLFSACGKDKNKQETPEYNLPIPREKLVNILADIYVAEASLIEYTADKQDSMRKLFITEIFTIHNLDKTYFDSIQRVLSNNVDLFNDVHHEVLDSINKPSVE
ncbi:MAG: DUF4296 domain-containing protein [Saprospiraceae bacterium]|nr:DUF4296 domain-containing protein [Saprospiraceae bacterium]